MSMRPAKDPSQHQPSLVPEGYTPPRPDAPSKRVIDYVMDQPAPPPDMSNIAKRLWDRFGGGENRALRAELYARLEREVETHGERAFRVIESCCKSAASARVPDRYFCGSVCRRLREHGMLQDGGGAL